MTKSLLKLDHPDVGTVISVREKKKQLSLKIARLRKKIREARLGSGIQSLQLHLMIEQDRLNDLKYLEAECLENLKKFLTLRIFRIVEKALSKSVVNLTKLRRLLFKA